MKTPEEMTRCELNAAIAQGHRWIEAHARYSPAREQVQAYADYLQELYDELERRPKPKSLKQAHSPFALQEAH